MQPPTIKRKRQGHFEREAKIMGGLILFSVVVVVVAVLLGPFMGR
jgi:hypothetical protein